MSLDIDNPCMASSWNVFEYRTALEEVRDVLLQEHNAPDAAAEVEQILAIMQMFEVRVGVRLNRLAEVFRVVVQHARIKASPEDVQAAIAKLRDF